MIKTKKTILLYTIILFSGLFLFSCTNEEVKKEDSSKQEIVYENENESPLKDIKEIKIDDNTKISLSFIKAGKFKMGSYEGVGGEDELPVREVSLTKCFLMGQYEITQKQWKALMKSGSDDLWFFGNDENKFKEYGGKTDIKSTYKVGKYKANPNGLYDLYGNVMEWCLDYYGAEYKKDDIIDPKGPDSGESRALRGGGWGSIPLEARSAYRNASGENIATDGIGFRIVINP